MKKIGIMGGTFNPIHLGHLILAQTALEECNLDQIIFIPSNLPHYKEENNVLSSTLRFRMVEEAIKDNDKFCISDVDILREGYTYTIDTVKDLKAQISDSDLYFIIGADSLFALEKWFKFEELAGICKFIAAARPGQDNSQISSKINYLEKNYSTKISMVNMPLIDISSTKIRQKVCNGKDIRYYVPESVDKFIKDNFKQIKTCWDCDKDE